MNEVTQEAELRLVIGQLEEFASRVSQELQEPSWETRREIIHRTLVRKVEVDEEGVRIVYQLRPSPFEQGPQHGSLLHCWGRELAPVGESLPALVREAVHPPGRPRGSGPRPSWCGMRMTLWFWPLFQSGRLVDWI